MLANRKEPSLHTARIAQGNLNMRSFAKAGFRRHLGTLREGATHCLKRCQWWIVVRTNVMNKREHGIVESAKNDIGIIFTSGAIFRHRNANGCHAG